jgi:hypothetical protein
VGDALTDPAFLQRLAERDQSAFKRVARAFLDFLNTLTADWRSQGSHAYLKDVEAFRDKLEQVLDQVSPASRQPGGIKALFLRVWHGTPHKGIEKTGFTLNKIGTGAGTQAYGWGMYFASMREVAQRYQPRNPAAEEAMMAEYNAAERRGDYESLELWEAALTHKLSDEVLSDDEFGHIPMAKRQAVARKMRAIGKKHTGDGSLYGANLPIEESGLLDWDKPLSEQSEKVLEAIQNSPDAELAFRADGTPRNIKGEDFIFAIRDEVVMNRGQVAQWVRQQPHARELFDMPDRAASEYLQSIGILGLRYLDGDSRYDGEGSHNYVIWDEALMTPEAAGIEAMYSRKASTKAAYEARIDALFAGGKPALDGVRVLDRSDVLV